MTSDRILHALTAPVALAVQSLASGLLSVAALAFGEPSLSGILGTFAVACAILGLASRPS